MMTTSVVELLSIIVERKPDENATLYGLSDYIVRERVKGFRSTSSAEPELPFGETLPDEYLELDGAS